MDCASCNDKGYEMNWFIPIVPKGGYVYCGLLCEKTGEKKQLPTVKPGYCPEWCPKKETENVLCE